MWNKWWIKKTKTWQGNDEKELFIKIAKLLLHNQKTTINAFENEIFPMINLDNLD